MKLLLILMLITYVVACVLLIFVVLRQEGKGDGISGMLSGGSAIGDTLGAQAGESFYRKATRNIAIIFLLFSLLITLVKKNLATSGSSILEKMPTPAQTPITTPSDANSPDSAKQPSEGAVTPSNVMGPLPAQGTPATASTAVPAAKSASSKAVPQPESSTSAKAGAAAEKPAPAARANIAKPATQPANSAAPAVPSKPPAASTPALPTTK